MTVDSVRPSSGLLTRYTKRSRIELSPRGVFWVAFNAFFILTTAWSLYNPLTASPDEQSHIKKAAATAYGQVFNEEILVDRVVDIPEVYRDVSYYLCNAFDRDVPISECETPLVDTQESPDGWVETPTPAARYNPLYYALVSWPALFSHSRLGIYLMRILSGALASFFLALGFRSLSQAKLPGVSFALAAAGLTPMVFFLAGSVNPQALELSSAFALWCQLLLVIRRTPSSELGPRMWLLAFIASVFANSRGLTPFFMTLGLLGIIALQPWKQTRTVIKDRRSWLPILVTFLATLAASIWILATGNLTSEEAPATLVTPRFLAVYTLRHTDDYIVHAVGSFGWLHAPMPLWAFMLFTSAFIGALLLIWMLAKRRERLVVFSSGILFCLIVPIVLHASQASSLGIMWQGRYILPMIMLIPVMASYVLADYDSFPEAPSARAIRAWAFVFWLVQADSIVFNLHRQLTGVAGTWKLYISPWQPPLPLWTVPFVLGAAGALIFFLFTRGGAPSHHTARVFEDETALERDVLEPAEKEAASAVEAEERTR